MHFVAPCFYYNKTNVQFLSLICSLMILKLKIKADKSDAVMRFTLKAIEGYVSTLNRVIGN